MNHVSATSAPRSWRWQATAATGALLLGLLLASSMWITPDSGVGRAAEASALGYFALFFVAATVLVAALALLLGGALAQSRLAAVLARANGERAALARLVDGWQWQTDAAHCLIRLAPPQGAPQDAWSLAAAHAGRSLWEGFRPADEASAAGLRARMQSRAALDDCAVVVEQESRAATMPARWLLRGEPLFDAAGRFAGYLGSARPVAEERAAGLPASHAAPPEPAGGFSDQEAFSYTVSHDLRAPIRVVDGFARILKEDYGRVLDRIGLDHLDRVLGAAARMNNMIDALLTLSQLSTKTLAHQPVNLSQLAGFVIDDLRRSAPERRVQVHIEPDLIAQGDPTLLRVVLENLLGNAWKYSARCETAQIRFERGGTAAAPSFTVRDNGAGFDMRFADRLFGVFQRLHSASDFEGTGVGLASVRRIIRRHGGEIWAESEVGRGAAFHFTLRA
jgi:signal transduction histidine kinase